MNIFMLSIVNFGNSIAITIYLLISKIWLDTTIMVTIYYYVHKKPTLIIILDFLALSSRIIERIFSGCVTRGKNRNTQDAHGPKMSYTDFVYFLLSEEDKNHATSIEYWFRCMDIDGDGVLSMYELEYFYEEQQHRMEQLGIETLPFEDCLCQVILYFKITSDNIMINF